MLHYDVHCTYFVSFSLFPSFLWILVSERSCYFCNLKTKFWISLKDTHFKGIMPLWEHRLEWISFDTVSGFWDTPLAQEDSDCSDSSTLSEKYCVFPKMETFVPVNHLFK